MRKEEKIGAALEARLDLYLDDALRARYAPAAAELRFFFITSDLALAGTGQRPADAVKVELAEGEAWVSATVSEAPKCVRCWHRRDDVGRHAEHPQLCGRCVENVDGPGEQRRWF
jgi:isoleucyl-tRNA synthetase